MDVELKQDELKVGMYVTVLAGKDKSFRGDVLEITAVDLPFIVIRWCNHSVTNPIVLDTRIYSLKKLSPEYIKQAMKKDD